MEPISWNDFEKIDIRVGTIMEVEDCPRARIPSYRLKVDLGETGIKNSSAQITKHYTKENLIGKQVLAVINFPPKNIAGFLSECLVLGAYDENGDVILVTPDKPASNGSKIG